MLYLARFAVLSSVHRECKVGKNAIRHGVWIVCLAGKSVFASEITFNMTRGATAISQQVYDLHMTIFYICCLIGLLVFGAMLWSIIHHRKSRGAQAAQFHESTRIELLWTAIPVLILVAMATPATSTLLKMEDTSKADLTVLITGSQWKWHYKYLEHPVAFYSLLATSKKQISGDQPKSDTYLREVDQPLVLPVGKKIRFLMTSDDVIHSWWVPAFAVKKDANPGYINESWTRIDRPGTYRGQCAELCGKDHGFMPIVVVAKTAEEFEGWIARTAEAQAAAKAQQQEQASTIMTLPQAMALGEKIFLGHCSACHQPGGTGLPGIFPALKGSKITTLAENRAQHLNLVLHGKSGTAMQAFGKQLTVQELAAVVTYERNAWGNNTGDVIQAADVQSILKNDK